ncbi:hypothetical protein B0H14DRAFT_2966611, partial [Mycena olivaceomarginata]
VSRPACVLEIFPPRSTRTTESSCRTCMGKYDTDVGASQTLCMLSQPINVQAPSSLVSFVCPLSIFQFNDPVWIRATVIILFVLDTTHSAVGIYAAWDLCVTNFNNPNILNTVDWMIPFTGIAVATSGVVTQVFLIHRVFKLTKNKWLVVFLTALSIGGYVCGWIACVKSGIMKDVEKLPQVLPLAIGWLALMCIADLLITAVLIFVLVSCKTGFRRTDIIINRLIRGAIQTGLFVSIFALGDLFSFIFAPHTSFHSMFAYPIGHIYTNVYPARHTECAYGVLPDGSAELIWRDGGAPFPRTYSYLEIVADRRLCTADRLVPHADVHSPDVS